MARVSALTGTGGGSKPGRSVPTTGPNTTSPPGLRVDVAALRRRGVDRHPVGVDLPTDWLGAILGDTDAEVRDPGHVDLQLMLPVDGPVIVSGTLKAHFDVPCGRCLDPARVTADASVTATYIPATGAAAPVPAAADAEDEDGVGLDEDDLDTFTYDGPIVDLSVMVAEYIKVAYPMRALCPRGEACRGLCSNCGAPLNEQPLAPRCAACGREVGGAEGIPQDGETEAEGPMAAALRKLRLPD